MILWKGKGHRPIFSLIFLLTFSMVTVCVAASYFIESLTLPSGPLIRLLSAAHKASNWRVPSIPNLEK